MTKSSGVLSKAPNKITYLNPPTIIIVIYLGSSGEINDKQRYRLCPKCSNAFEKETSPNTFCTSCGSYYPKDGQKLPEGLVKIGIILATIVIDIALLLGSGLLGGLALAANNLAVGIFALPAVMGIFCYVIGGNKATYQFLKSISRYVQRMEEGGKFDWNPVKKAIKGDGFMVGVAIFIMLTSIILAVIIASQFGDLGDDSYRGLAKVIIIIALLALILPLMGFAAKMLGNEKAASELGYNSIRGVFFMIHGGKKYEDGSDSGAGGDGSTSASGDGAFSF